MKDEKEIVKRYIDLTEQIQNEYERNVEKYGEKIKCKNGCSQCCYQIFRITELDSNVIKVHLSNLSVEKQKALKDKAENYINESSKIKSESVEFFSKPKLPCPALDVNGSCMIYEARPVICRRFGPPVFDYKNPEKLFACELNFAGGEEIIDDLLIPNQTEIGKNWDELKTFYNLENNLKSNASTTIAEALFNSKIV